MTIKAKVIAINKLLSDVEQKPMRMSYLLEELDFSTENISFIADRLLSETATIFLDSLSAVLLDCRDGKRLFTILNDLYGLGGESPQTLQSIGEKFAISRERVRQLKVKGLKKVKAYNNREKWRNTFKVKILELLAQNISNKDYYLESDSTNSEVSSGTQYQFSIDSSKIGDNHLILSNSLKTPTTDRIIITEATVSDFYDEFMEKVKLLKWQSHLKIKKFSNLEAIKEEHQRAYEPWTSQEQQTLISKFELGISIKEIASILERQPSAINARLKKLGLK